MPSHHGAGSVAIVHDYLTQRGGAERVVLQLAAMFPGAPVYTSIFDPSRTFSGFADLDVRTSHLDGRVTSDGFRRAVLSYPGAFRRLDLSTFDTVVVSSSAFAHHVEHPNVFVYCYTPPRFLYQVNSYFRQPALRTALRPVLTVLRRADRAAAGRARCYATISRVSQHRIARAYGRAAQVIHPQLRVGHLPDDLAPPPSRPRALVIARLLPYKRVEVAVRACALAGVPLTVVGDGPQRARLEALGAGTTEFVGLVRDGELADLFAEHSVLLAPGIEDFGYIPLEASFAGRPVVARGEGGAVETVEDDVSGYLVTGDDPAAWACALQRALQRDWSMPALRANAERFLPARFERAILEWVGGAPEVGDEQDADVVAGTATVRRFDHTPRG